MGIKEDRVLDRGAKGMGGMIQDEGGGCIRKKGRGVYSKRPISRNAKPSSDAPQTKHLIMLIVRHIPQLNVCVPMRARCVVNSAHTTDTKNLNPQRFSSKMSHRYV